MDVEVKNFDLFQIADSGQCFRMKQLDQTTYEVISRGNYVRIAQSEPNCISLSCDEGEYENFWKKYLDMDFPYEKKVEQLLQDNNEYLRNAVGYGSGIRILHQDPFEMMITFILSQNKNIPGIKKCVEDICRTYGKKCRDLKSGTCYYSFPTPEELGKATAEELRELKTGYRDQYILAAVRSILDKEIEFEQIRKMQGKEAVEELKKIHGIGEKVASCIALFGFHKMECYPVDVWIKRAMEEQSGGIFPWEEYDGFQGLVQQYIFYYIRGKKT